MLKKILVVISLYGLMACSSTPRGSDIVFSHSEPTAPDIICPAPAAEPEAINVKLASPISVATVVYFDTDLYSLNTDAIQQLDTLVRDIDQRVVRELVITGHTDSRASLLYNDKLSQRRASAVVDYLTAKNILSDNSVITWRGERLPAASNSTVDGMALNRRTEVQVLLAP